MLTYNETGETVEGNLYDTVDEEKLTKESGEISFNYAYECKNLKNQKITYNMEDVNNFRYEIVYVPFHTRLEERAVNDKPTLYVQQPNLKVSKDKIVYIYGDDHIMKNDTKNLNKIIFYISLQKAEKSRIVTVINIHIPYKYTHETGLTSFEIIQVHSCTQKYAFLSNLVYVNNKIEFRNLKNDLKIITKKLSDNEVIAPPYFKVNFGKSNFSEQDTDIIVVDNLNTLTQDNFSDKNLSLIFVMEEGRFSEFVMQSYFYPPLHIDKIYNLHDIDITFFSNSTDSVITVKEPIYKRTELPSGVMPGFDPNQPIFEKHKVIEYTPGLPNNIIEHGNIKYPQLIFSCQDEMCKSENIVYDKNPLQCVRDDPKKIAYNIWYHKENNGEYKLSVNIILPHSFTFNDPTKSVNVVGMYPVGYDFIAGTINTTYTLALNNSTLLITEYPIVTRKKEHIDSVILPSYNRIEIECMETGNEIINLDNIVVLPIEYINDMMVNKISKENKDIVFFGYTESEKYEKKNFFADIHLSKNSIYSDGTFKYNCKINIPYTMKDEIDKDFLVYTIPRQKFSEDLEINYNELFLEDKDKTYFQIHYLSPMVKKSQVKAIKIDSISEIEKYLELITSDINVLFHLEKNYELGTYKFNIYVIVPYEYIDENFGQPIALTPVFSPTDKLYQGVTIKYMFGNNHVYTNIDTFTYDVQILTHAQQIKITHKPNIKKLYVKLNGKGLGKEDVDVYYKNDLALTPIKNNTKINIIIEFDRTDIGNVYVTAIVKIPHNFLVKYNNPTVLLMHDVDPFYNFSQRIKTITTYDEGEPQSQCSIMGKDVEFEDFVIPLGETINVISGKIPRIYIFLKTDKIQPNNLKVLHKPYTNNTGLLDRTDLNIYVTSNVIDQCNEDVNIVIVGRKNLFSDEIYPASIQVIYPQHIHGINKISQTYIFY